MKIKHGFTLIEILFVVVIFAVLSALLVSSYQQSAVNQKVEKTALQMQEILQAATAYYNDTGGWPDSNAPVPNFDNYLPVGLTQNPWGATYFYQATNNQFTVNSGILPSSNLALRVQSLLPNATINPNDPLQVLLVPTTAQPDNNIVEAIGVTGMLTDGSTAAPFQVTCPAGKTPSTITIPRDFNNINDYDGCFDDITRPFGLLYAPTQCSPDNQYANTYTCRTTVSFNGVLPKTKGTNTCISSSKDSRGSGSVQFTYIAWCQ